MVEKEGEKTSSKEKAIPKKVILDGIIKKIDYYSNRNSVTDLDLYYLIKEFFKEFLELNYEFSLEELMQELDKIYIDETQRTKIDEFIKEIRIIEYTDGSFSQDYIKDRIKELSSLTKHLMKTSYTKKKGFWAKLGSLFSKKKEKKTPPSKEEIDAFDKKVKETGLESVMSKEFITPGEIPTDDAIDSLKKYDALQSDPLMAPVVNPNKAHESKYRSDLKNYIGSDTIPEDTSKKKSKEEKTPEKEQKENYNWAAYESLTPTPTPAKEEKQKESPKEKEADKSPIIPIITSEKKVKDDFGDLLKKAKSMKNKEELVELYKKLHETYNNSDTDFQAKHYPDLMSIYNKISNMSQTEAKKSGKKEEKKQKITKKEPKKSPQKTAKKEDKKQKPKAEVKKTPPKAAPKKEEKKSKPKKK